MNEKFDKCIKFVLDREGREYENNAADPGGETKFGISKKSYPHIDIAGLTEDRAKEIYFNDYWLPMGCDNYENRMALAIFDTAVNQGASVARAILAEMTGVPLSAEAFLFKRLRRYCNLVQRNPKLIGWLDDWLLRVVKLTEYQF